MSGSLSPRPHPYTGPRVGVGSGNETRCLAVTFLLSSGALTCALLYTTYLLGTHMVQDIPRSARRPQGSPFPDPIVHVRTRAYGYGIWAVYLV